LLKFRPVRRGGRVAIVAPASAFEHPQLAAGVAELERIGLRAVYDETLFERGIFTAGPAALRAKAMMRAFEELGADAVLAVRGGYGSMEVLPFLDVDRIRRARLAFIGFSDVTAVHSFLNATVGMTSIHGPMIQARLAKGRDAYDADLFLRALDVQPLGELIAESVEVLQAGEACGTLVGGTLTQLLASLETPYVFQPPQPHVLFVDDVGERPYRIHRMLTQLRMSGRLSAASALVFGQMPECDEPGGEITARDAIVDFISGFSGPILYGFPSGHTTTPLMTLPFGVRARVLAGRGSPRLVIEEAAAAD
jgi:muramoyltetrapeptide carboxypeptidase